MDESQKFKHGQGMYAYASFVAGAFLPPALIVSGRTFGAIFYLALIFAYLLLGKRRFLEGNGMVWITVSVILSTLGVVNRIAGLGFGSSIVIVLLVFGALLVARTIFAVRNAYLRKEF